MEIKVSDLWKISERLFRHLEEAGISSVEINADYYWNISADQVYDPYKEPDQLDMGQLSDDWSDLEKILSNEMEPISYNMVDLSAILRAIGEKLVT